MENMKRALSAFLAFVLVLGMVPAVPMFASAQEVETQPETVAVETTEAVTEETEAPETTAPAQTVPETTAAAQEETVPETTAVQETEPAETLPQETEPAETLPQETEPAETLPQETEPAETLPEETIPQETQEEVTAAEEAADSELAEEFVTGITVKASKTLTYLGDEITLTPTVTPSTAVDQDVVFKVLPEVEGLEDYDPPTVDEEKLAEGIVSPDGPGKLAIGWHSSDGNYDPFFQLPDAEQGDAEMPEPLWLEFIDYGMDINTKSIDKDHVDEDGGYKVMVGDTMGVSVRYLDKTEPTEQFPDGEPISPIHTPKVKWSLSEEDQKYASLSVSADTRQVTIIPKNLDVSQQITLTAKDENLFGLLGEDVVDSILVWIIPVPYKVSIRMDGEEVNGKTIPLNVNDYLFSNENPPSENWIQVALDADVLPVEAGEELDWTASDSGTKIIHEKISVDPEPVKYDTTHAEILMPVEAGKTVITVTSKKDHSLTAQVTFERKFLLKSFAFATRTAKLEDLTSGESFQLQAVRILPTGKLDKEILESDVIQWKLENEEDEEFVTLSKDGKLTARKNLVRGKKITVICSVIDNEDVFLTKEVNVRPKATDVEIFFEDEEEAVTGETRMLDASELETGDTIQLAAVVYPISGSEEYLGAKGDVTWSSSKTSIATVGKTSGKVEWKGNSGTVTITAKASDGKSGSVKLQFGAKVQEIEIDAPYQDDPDMDFILTSGKSYSLDVTVKPKNATNKALIWTLEVLDENGNVLEDEDAGKYASISASGRLTAKTVYEKHLLRVTAEAKDGFGAPPDSIYVTIAPKNADQLSIYADDVPVTKTTLPLAKGDVITVEARAFGRQAAVSWGPAKSSVVDVEDNGDGTATITVKKTGSATIKATADDKRTATFTIKGVQQAEEIIWTHKHEQETLVSGKSLSLSAKAYWYNEDGKAKTPTVSKLAWSFEEENASDYATISSSGKVTAKAGHKGEPVDLTVVVKTTDGSDLSETWPITITPAPEALYIYQGDSLATSETFAMVAPGEDALGLTAKAFYPGAEEAEEIPVTWKSSSKTVAEVLEDGTVICKKAGSATITATANDGSGKKATFKLKIVAVADFATLDAYWDGTGIPVAGGKKLTLKGLAYDGSEEPKLIKNKKFKWYVSDKVDDKEYGSDYASISGSTLKTKEVNAEKTVWLTVMTVESKEEWVASSTFAVKIRPATTKVTIINEKGNTPEKFLGYVGRPVQILAKANDGACQAFVWKSSNPKVADYVWNEETGTVELMCFKAGTVTITATAMDGTKKSAKIKLEIVDVG